MPVFKDANNREWVVKLDAPTIKEVRDTFDGLDLIDGKGESYLRLAADPILLIDVLWVICRKQANGNITDEQFGQSLVGDPIEQATEALLKAILDFFPSRKRQAIQALVTTHQAVTDRGMEMALAKISNPALRERALAAVEADMDAMLEKALTQLSSATNSPASSESAPTD